MKKVISVLIAMAVMLSSVVIAPSIKASAAINDGSKLSIDINLEAGRYSASTDTFTPLKAGEALTAGSIITVRICPKTDFLAGVTRYIVMFNKSYLQIEGAGNAAFTPNIKNTFYSQVSAGYAGASNIPDIGWPSTFSSSENYTVYSAVAVNNQANSNSANGGYPGLLPGTWLFRFNLKVLKDITAGSNARIWMDKRWIRTPSNITGASFFVKCESAGQLSATGKSTTYNFKVDLKDADIKLPLKATSQTEPNPIPTTAKDSGSQAAATSQQKTTETNTSKPDLNETKTSGKDTSMTNLTGSSENTSSDTAVKQDDSVIEKDKGSAVKIVLLVSALSVIVILAAVYFIKKKK